MNSVQTENAACTTTGAIARDSTGKLLTCQGGQWKPTTSGAAGCEQTTADANTLQTGGACYLGSNLPNAPTTEWVSIEVLRRSGTDYYLSQRATGLSGAAAGRVWMRQQQSAGASGGWTAWVQVIDPQVSVSSGNVTAAGTVQGSYLYSTGNVSASNVVVSNNGMYTWSNSNWAFLGGDSSGNWYTSPGSHIGSAYLNDAYFRSIGMWASNMASAARTNRCSGDSCSVYLPVYGRWSIFATARHHQASWCGGSLYINGAYVDGLANFGDQQGTGYGVMFGAYEIWAGPGTIPVWANWCGSWGDGAIGIVAVKGGV